MSATHRLLRARQLLDVGRPIDALRLVAPDLARSAEARTLAARAYAELEDYEESLAYALDALELDPANVEGLLLASQAALEVGSLDQAIRLTQSAVQQAPDSPDALVQLAYALAWDRPRAARAAALRAAEIAPLSEVPLLALAHLSAKVGDHRSAEHLCLSALSLNPGNPTALNNLAIARMRLGKPSGTAGLFASALIEDPQAGVSAGNLSSMTITLLRPAHLGLAGAWAACGAAWAAQTAGVISGEAAAMAVGFGLFAALLVTFTGNAVQLRRWPAGTLVASLREIKWYAPLVNLVAFALAGEFALFLLGAGGQPLSVITLLTGALELATVRPIWFPMSMRGR